MFRFLPESSKWLISQGRHAEAWKIVGRFSKKSQIVKLAVHEVQDSSVGANTSKVKPNLPDETYYIASRLSGNSFIYLFCSIDPTAWGHCPTGCRICQKLYSIK
jgi:hypothetical protein